MFREDSYPENNNENADSPSTSTTTTAANNNSQSQQQTAAQDKRRGNKHHMILHPTTLSMLSKMYKNHHHHCFWPTTSHGSAAIHSHRQLRRSSVHSSSSSSNNNSHNATTTTTTTTTTTRRHSSSTPCFKPTATICKPFALTKHNSLLLRAGPPPTPLPNSILSSTTTDTLPPINFDTLKELSAHHIFKSLQLRHDLLLDAHLSFRPNLDGTCGREKKKRAERYWRHLDHNLRLGHFDCLKSILTELSKILVSLMNPFDGSPASGTSFVWMWPIQVTKQHVQDALDADLLIQQLKNGSLLNMDWLIVIFEQLMNGASSSQHHQLRLEMMKQYFMEAKYAKALKQCFYILELIKLDCANRVIRHYRTYLLETCAEFEYRCFIKQPQKDQTLAIDSISSWFKQAATLLPQQHQPQQQQQLNKLDYFKSVYYTGLVQIVTDHKNNTLPAMTTLQFDQKRLTTDFRYEFQNLIVLSILLVPYRHVAGKLATQQDMNALKQLYTQLFKNEQTSTTNWCQVAAVHACQLGFQKRNAPVDQEKVQFWNNWLIQHLKSASAIFELMSDRFSKQLVYFAQHGQLRKEQGEAVVDVTMDEQIEELGKKIKLVANLNLETFGAVYKSIFGSSSSSL